MKELNFWLEKLNFWLDWEGSQFQNWLVTEWPINNRWQVSLFLTDIEGIELKNGNL